MSYPSGDFERSQPFSCCIMLRQSYYLGCESMLSLKLKVRNVLVLPSSPIPKPIDYAYQTKG